jgi:hypothetical protein
MALITINSEEYAHEVLPSSRLTLLCFFKNPGAPGESNLSLAQLSQEFDAVVFCVVQEDELEFFFDEFHFFGTPIFIFLVNGLEHGRLMGRVSEERLRTFVDRMIREVTIS